MIPTGAQVEELVGQEYWSHTNDTAQGVLHMSNIPNISKFRMERSMNIQATSMEDIQVDLYLKECVTPSKIWEQLCFRQNDYIPKRR